MVRSRVQRDASYKTVRNLFTDKHRSASEAQRALNALDAPSDPEEKLIIENFKAIIADDVGIAVNEQKLMGVGELMEHGQLKDYVKDMSTIYCVRDLEGGGAGTTAKKTRHNKIAAIISLLREEGGFGDTMLVEGSKKDRLLEYIGEMKVAHEKAGDEDLDDLQAGHLSEDY